MNVLVKCGLQCWPTADTHTDPIVLEVLSFSLMYEEGNMPCVGREQCESYKVSVVRQRYTPPLEGHLIHTFSTHTHTSFVLTHTLYYTLL